MSAPARFVLLAAVSALGSLASCNSRGALVRGGPPDGAPAGLAMVETVAPAAPVTPRTEPPRVAKNLSAAFAATARAVRPSVVRVDVQGPSLASRLAPPPDDDDGSPGGLPPAFRRFFNFDQGSDAPGSAVPAPVGQTGSGMILDEAGRIVTNSHVVGNATSMKVTLWDGQELPAKLVGRDTRTDVAVIQLEHLPATLVVARPGDSDQAEVGQWVLAVGSPLGLDQTVTVGIVSGKGHVGKFVQMSGDRVRGYLQTDAKINPGNSGGPLVNLDGEVIGMNTLIRTGAGGAYGFAVPINEVRRVAQALIKEGRIHYPFLGVVVRDLDGLDPILREKLGPGAPATGAYVVEVTPGGPGAKAGIKPGDVITRLDGEPVKSGGDVISQVSSRPIGATVSLTLYRDGAVRTVNARLVEAAGDGGPGGGASDLGLALQTLTPELADSIGLPPTTRGAVITEVADGSPAQRSGLEPGEVVLDVDRRPVHSAEEAGALVTQARSGGHLLRVYGRSGVRFVTLGAG